MQTQNQPNPNGGNVNFQQNANAELTAPQTETNEYLGGNSGRLAPATCSAAALSDFEERYLSGETTHDERSLMEKDGWNDQKNLTERLSAEVRMKYMVQTAVDYLEYANGFADRMIKAGHDSSKVVSENSMDPLPPPLAHPTF